MKHNWIVPRQLYYENQYLYNQCKELNEKLKIIEGRCKELVANENANINKILLLENKIISLKRKLNKQNRSVSRYEEQIFYLDSINNDIEVEVIQSDVSSITDSNN
jgi:peptidoglycan hydrolase CwlO-like protein